MDGVAVGSLYALIALGYTMVYGTLQFINFAHSDIFVLGAWISYTLAVGLGYAVAGTSPPAYAGFLILLAAMAFAPTFEVGVALFLARMSIASMDVGSRQQFVVSVVEPRERTAAAGITNTGRNVAQAGGPFVIGPIVAVAAIGGPFVVAGILKLVYDGSLLRSFGKTPEVPPDS